MQNLRTTIDIPERLLRQAKAEAALRGLTAKSILADVNVWLAIPLDRSRRSTPTW